MPNPFALPEGFKLIDDEPVEETASLGYELPEGFTLVEKEPPTEYHPVGAAKTALYDTAGSLGKFIPAAAGAISGIAPISKAVLGTDPFETIGKTAKDYYKGLADSDEDVAAFRDSVKRETESVLTEAGASAGPTIAAIGMRLAGGPIAGRLLSTSYFYSLNKDEIKDMALAEGADPQSAETVSTVGGVINTALDSADLEVILKAPGLAKLGKKLHHWLWGAASGAVVGYGSERATEQTQDIVARMAVEYAKGRRVGEKSSEWLQRMWDNRETLWDESKRAGEVGGVMGAVFGGAVGTAQGLLERKRTAVTLPIDPGKMEREAADIVEQARTGQPFTPPEPEPRGLPTPAPVAPSTPGEIVEQARRKTRFATSPLASIPEMQQGAASEEAPAIEAPVETPVAAAEPAPTPTIAEEPIPPPAVAEEVQPETGLPHQRALKIGDAVKMMGVDSILAESETIGGIRYDLFNADSLKDERSTVRVYDEESGEVVAVKQYPNYDAAETEFKEAVAIQRKEVTPSEPEVRKAETETEVEEGAGEEAKPAPIKNVIPYDERPKEEKALINAYNKKMDSDEWVKAYEDESDMEHFAKEEGHSPLADELLRDLEREGLQKGAAILEIGSGQGRDGTYLARKGHSVKGIDVSEKAVAIANKKAKGESASFEVGDAENLYQFEDGSQDAVYSVAALHGTPIKFTFKEIFRVLKPGGQAKLFLYTRTKTGNKWVSYWTPNEIRQYAEENGFKIEKFREKSDAEPIEIPGVTGKVEQETHLVVTTLRKPKPAPAATAKEPVVTAKETPPSKGVPVDIAKRLLALPPEQRTHPFGDYNKKFRQEIMEALTGQNVPIKKAGAQAVQRELIKALGVTTEGKAPVEWERETEERLRELVQTAAEKGAKEVPFKIRKARMANFHDFVKSLGGVRVDDRTWKGEIRDMRFKQGRGGKIVPAFPPSLFTASQRLGVDDLTNQAIEAGWLAPESTEEDFMNALVRNPKDRYVDLDLAVGKRTEAEIIKGMEKADETAELFERIRKNEIDDAIQKRAKEEAKEEIAAEIPAEILANDREFADFIDKATEETADEIMTQGALFEAPEEPFKLTPTEPTLEEKMAIGKEFKKPPTEGKPRAVIPEGPIPVSTKGKQAGLFGTTTKPGQTPDMFEEAELKAKKAPAEEKPTRETWKDVEARLTDGKALKDHVVKIKAVRQMKDGSFEDLAPVEENAESALIEVEGKLETYRKLLECMNA